MNRCAYCKKKAESDKTAVRIWKDGNLKTIEWTYCSSACKENIHSFVKSYNRFAPKLMLVIVVWMVLFLVLPFILNAITGNPVYIEVGSPVMLALLGAVLTIYPLGIVTTKYYERLGIKYTNLFIRLTGLLMIITGLTLIWAR